MKFKPYEYQEYAEQFIIEHPEAGLFLDMGMGKTVITLSALHQLKFDYFRVHKVLIIAPLAPARSTWPSELTKWAHLRDFTFTTVLGTAQERQDALEENVDIYIINRENVSWLVNHLGPLWFFDTVVIDELSSFKSHRAKRFRDLRRVRKRIKRIVGLTGTPAPNGYLDLWAQLYLLDEGEALGRTLKGYQQRYFTPGQRNAVTIFTWNLKPGAKEEIQKAIEPICVSMDSADYLDLPERLNIQHEVELPPKAMEMYKQMEKDMFIPYADGDIDAQSAAILSNKLLQMASGRVYDENKGIKEIHTEKLKKLEDLVEAANGQPVLIFYAYAHEKDQILEKYPEAVLVKEEGAVERWNKGEIPIMLAHPASAGHGLNLQHGGHIAIWFGLTWSLELYQQANKRLHRIGQEKTVLVHHILAKGTIDDTVLNTALQSKEKTQTNLLDALRARIEETVNEIE